MIYIQPCLFYSIFITFLVLFLFFWIWVLIERIDHLKDKEDLKHYRRNND